MSITVPRRQFLHTMAALGALGAAGSVLSSCGRSPSAGAGDPGATAALPTYRAAEVAKADLAGTAAGVSPAYLAYPAAPTSVVKGLPAAGGKITALTFTYDPIAPDRGRNDYWQAVEKALGAEVGLSYAPAADYKNRFATTIAGNSLPDLVSVMPPQPQLPAMLRAKFTDLSEYLSGDAIADYPYLAAIPTASWKTTRYGGGIYGVPVPRSIVGGVMYTRGDILETKGLPTAPANYQEFADLCRGLTDERARTWAAGNYSTVFSFITEMLRIPSGWSAGADGKLVNSIESPEYQHALANTAELAAEGIFHPDAVSAQNTSINQWLAAGQVSLNLAGYAGWYKYFPMGAGVDGFRMDGMIAPGYDGGAGLHAPGNPSAAFTAIAKTDDKEKVKMLLRVLNWLNSPFGSSEYVTRRFGAEGSDYALSGSDPVLTSRGASETVLPYKYIADSATVLYDPKYTAGTKLQHAYQEKVVPQIKPSATLGMYSETDATKGSQLAVKLDSVRQDIFAGRKKATVWADTVKDWRKTGGDDIRGEYEKALAG